MEVVAVNQTEPTCWFRMALISAAPSRLFARPSEKSWPIRWAMLIRFKTCCAQEA